MQAFHINAPTQGGTFTYRDISVDTAIADGAATAAVTTRSGVTNPIYVATSGAIGPADAWSRSSERVVQGAGSSPLADAVASLHALGEAHGVTGINLSTDPTQVGSVQLVGRSYFEAGGPTTAKVGAEPLRQIDAAARTVLDLVTATAD